MAMGIPKRFSASQIVKTFSSWTFFDPILIFAMRYQKLIARLNYAGFYYFRLLFVSVDEQFFSFLTGFIVWLKSCEASLLSGNWQSGPR